MTLLLLLQQDPGDTLPVPAPSELLDSVVVESPVPDPFVPIVQWIFQQPPWVMQLGIVLAAIAAVIVGVLLWRRRETIRARLRSLTRPARLALVGGIGVLVLGGAMFGYRANQYVMHDNDFCRGCHIFVPSGHAWVKPDTGSYLLVNALEGEHDTLSCHACHPFELAAQTRELYYWIMDRPEDVPPHGKVPRDVCEQCHVQGAAKETWQQIAATAGHRTHFESDSALAIAVELEARAVAEIAAHRGEEPPPPRPPGAEPLPEDFPCLTCHARSAHRFQPPDSTCAQQGCHLTDEIDIRLGRMADQTGLHCGVCHQFTAEVPLLATRDSAAGTLRPARSECLGCHAMREVLTDFDPAADPHGGTCGMCHNPHTQARPEDALKSCATGGCHADWRAVPFHVGQAHRGVSEQCQTCHEAHKARVDASDCTGCHTEVQRRSRGRITPPQPFDTTDALRRVSMDATVRLEMARDAPAATPAQAAADTFSHPIHRELPCLTCHVPAAPRSRLTFVPPRGCQICHHQAPATSRCAECHDAEELAHPAPVTFAVTVERAEPAAAPRERSVPFEHTAHADLRCTECHVTPVTLAPSEAVRACNSCHESHHEAGRTCATCHRSDATLAAHEPLSDAHERCTECHTTSVVAVLQPTRSFCLGCHPASVDHYAPRECAACHFLTTPEAMKPRLVETAGQ
jgi:hypothetical protein